MSKDNTTEHLRAELKSLTDTLEEVLSSSGEKSKEELNVAIFASYTALNMAGRVAGSARSNARIWLMGGGFALGVGIWAM
ncbi:DUF883 family protein, partial [Salmonella enterica subsp. enterica serovar Kentucky]|nr:DUF883 family protein [Salmonella enterica subsp. enterica serovar Kentucky]